MSMTLSGDAFDRMCREDAEWLERVVPGRCLEKDHILSILRTCRRYYYTPANVVDRNDGVERVPA